MFSPSDLSTLISDVPQLGVSIFMPTHRSGAEIRQDPIRLKNLVRRACTKLEATGLSSSESGAMLAPVSALIDDHLFWRHQDQGLALFLGNGDVRYHKVPISFSEQVIIGHGYHVKPLLPVLAHDGAFRVLTITASNVRLFDASRFSMSEIEDVDLPRELEESIGQSDYENPVQASPANRPNVGSTTATNAQVYGDSPEEWRKGRLVEFIRQIAAALERQLIKHPVPVVLAADAEIHGHFQKLSGPGSQLAGVIEVNPEGVDRKTLHDAAYNVMEPHFTRDRDQAFGRFRTLLGAGDARAATTIDDIVRHAHEGRVDTLLLSEGNAAWGRFDEESGQVSLTDNEDAEAQDLVDTALVWTLRHGGKIYLLLNEMLPEPIEVAAVLRY